MNRTCTHRVPDIPVIVADWLAPTVKGRVRREENGLVVTVLERYPAPGVTIIGTKRPEPGECPVCDG